MVIIANRHISLTQTLFQQVVSRKIKYVTLYSDSDCMLRQLKKSLLGYNCKMNISSEMGILSVLNQLFLETGCTIMHLGIGNSILK